jgi:Ca-activated chloride channel family protein
MGRHLAHPEWLAALAVLVIGLALALGIARRVASHRAQRLLGPGAPGRLPGAVTDGVLILSLALVALALLGPRLSTRTRLVPGTGADVVVLFDVSASMDAPDTPPTRLARAREIVRRALSALEPADRAALAAFATRGVLLTPLTSDTNALEAMLPALDDHLMQHRGSRLDAGLSAALAAFDPESRRPRTLLLLSDGEDSAHEGVTAGPLQRAGIRVVAVALGSEAGTTIRVSHTSVHTRRELSQLDELATATDGALFAGGPLGQVDVARLVAAVRRDASHAPGEAVERREPVTWVAPFVALAFGLLVLELALPAQRLIGLATVAALAVAAGPAGQGPDGSELLALGVLRAERGDADEAARALFAAAARSRDPELAALAYYDLGVVEIQRGRLESARAAFFDALALRPGDPRTQFNLEWTLRALRSEPSPPPESRPDEDASDEPEPDERPKPSPESSRQPSPEPVPELSPEETQRWLEQVDDDASRSLRDAAERAAAAAPRPPRDLARW